MEHRVAMICIIVEAKENVKQMNDILHDYGFYIIGRMGIPYPKRNISMISIMIDAPQDKIAALSGKLGALQSIQIKTLYSSVKANDDESNH